MELTRDKRIALLLSNEILLDDGFFVLLEQIDFKVRNFELDELDFRIYIDKSIEEVIEQHTNNNNRREATRIKGVIKVLQTLSLYEEIDTDNFFNYQPLLDLQKDKLKDFEITFITNTKANAERLFLIDKEEVFFYKRFLEGTLSKWTLERKVEEPVIKKSQASKQPKAIPKTLQKSFHTEENSHYIHTTEQENINYVYSEKFGYLKLVKDNIMEGGEGKIYRTYDNLMVKIYTKDERRYELVKKIQHMIDLHLRNSHIVWPKDIVYNGNEFVGYIMDEIEDAKGLDMYRIYSFRNLSYLDRFQICIDLLKLTDYLHNKGILIGDLKFDNIMYKEKTKELYIIDSASFQIEDYSCGVFNADYTHDNLRGKNLREVLRTLEEEHFPINKILFEILMGKGPYYDFQSGEVGSEVERVFHYPLEVKKEITNQNDPLFFWSHADDTIRHAFYDYFKNDIITEVPTWINLLENILKEAK